MNIEQARDIAIQFSPEKVLRLEPIDIGGDSKTFRVFTENGNLILRTAGMRSNYDVEHAVLKLLTEKGVQAPFPLYAKIDSNDSTSSFSLQKEIPGTDLNHSNLPKSLWPEIINEVGENLRIIHSIEINGFGNISPDKFRDTGKIVGGYNSWFDFVNYYFNSRVQPLIAKIEVDKKNGFKDSQISKELQEKILEIISKIPVVIDRARTVLEGINIDGVLLHGDLHADHFLVKNNRLSGIIDFNNAMVGDPILDIAYFSIMPHGELYPHLLKENDLDIDQQRFNLYRMLISIGKIHTRYVRHDYLKDYPEILDIALDEIKKQDD